MECKVSKKRRVYILEVKVEDYIIPQVTRFKYLGSVIQNNREIEGDVNHWIQVERLKWMSVSGILCDTKVSLKLNGKFYRTAVKLLILYGIKYWALKNQNENKVNVVEMRIFHWMWAKTRHSKIRNDNIRESVRVVSIVEKMMESKLWWFGHVERRLVD